jgi:hypothetical protein
MNDKTKRATLAEAGFIVDATHLGWEVAKPFHQSAGYDFVAYIGGNWRTVQVKAAYSNKRRTGLEVSTRRCNEKRGSRPYRDGEFDYLYVWHESRAWIFPWKSVSRIRSAMSLQTKLAEKHEIVERV